MPLTPQVLRGLRRRPWPTRPGWISPGPSLPARRWNSAGEEKPFYITTPIFYVNAAPHLGHLYSMVLADVLKRWEQLSGRQAVLSTGTDEHGMKIQRASLKADMDPQSFCDGNSAKFRELAEAADISHDSFVRTTDQEHKDAVAHFWLRLKHTLPESLGLYKGVHEGWYCVSDECFYPADMVRAHIVPQTGRKTMVSVETDNEVEWVKEETWFFPLSRYRDALLGLYDERPEWIKPAHRMKEVRHWVEHHLEDLSVTRPAARLSWGVADPEDASQTIYVWVDALINYLTKAGYGTQWTEGGKGANAGHDKEKGEPMGLWPADVHVIGKDILRFHAVYWPALLMSLGLPVPREIVCHNHWTMSNRKMSKSLGNVVNPFFAIQRWGVDPLRYFLMRSASLSKDMGYSNTLVGAVYAKELQANLGNLFYRIAKPKASTRWSLHDAVAGFRGGEFEGIRRGPKSASEEIYYSLGRALAETPAAFVVAMEEYDTGAAMRHIFNLLRETNRYVSDTKPWDLARTAQAEDRRMLHWVVFHAAEALRIAAILLQPTMPSKARELLDGLGVGRDRRSLAYARKGADVEYGGGTEKTARTSKWQSLFPPTPGPEESDEELMDALGAALEDRTRNKMNQMAEYLAMEARMGEEGVADFLARRGVGKVNE